MKIKHTDTIEATISHEEMVDMIEQYVRSKYYDGDFCYSHKEEYRILAFDIDKHEQGDYTTNITFQRLVKEQDDE